MKKAAILLSSLSLVGTLLVMAGTPTYARADSTGPDGATASSATVGGAVADSSTAPDLDSTPSAEPTETSAEPTPTSAEPAPTSAKPTSTAAGSVSAASSTTSTSSTAGSSTPTLQPAALSPNVTPAPVTPDLAYTTAQGGRVEVYSSVGNNDGDSDNSSSVDWRQVNEFAYLISSVPKGQQLNATVYNSYWDQDKAQLVNGKWVIVNAATGKQQTSGIYGPTQAFMDQLNQYSSPAEAAQYIHVLGNKSTINDALNPKANAPYGASSLASLLKQAGVMKLCTLGLGACLATGHSATDELMHAKYAVFGQAKDSTGQLWNNVIWITSANLNGQSGGKKSNLSIALFGDASAASQILTKFWTPEINQNGADPGYLDAARNGIVGTNTDFTFYPSPRSTDFEANYLKSITNSALKQTKTGCKVYVVHSLFSSARTDLAAALAAMQTDKCDVRLVLGESSVADIVDSYFSMSTSLRELINRVEFANVHDKTMAVEYTTNGQTTGVTWAGSANFNGTSLQFDELAVRVNNLTVTRAVQQQFSRLYPLSRVDPTKRVPVTGVTVSPTAPTIAVGSTVTIRAKITPTSPTVGTVLWSSSNPSVASVNSSGKVTAVGVGSATITARTLSGVKTANSTVKVVAVGDPTDPPTTDPVTGTTKVTVSQAPRVTIPRQPSPSANSQITVTWGQGLYDIKGKVELQWYSATSKKWKHGAWMYTDSSGRAIRKQKLASSRTWRVKAVSVSGLYLNRSTVSGVKASLKSGRYSPWAYVTVRTKKTSSTVHLYAAYLFRSGTTIPFLIVWKNPYGAKYTSTFSLQYKSGRKWVTLKDASGKSLKLVFGAGRTQQLFGADNQVKSRTWRVVTVSSSMPKGKAAKHSESRSIKIG